MEGGVLLESTQSRVYSLAGMLPEQLESQSLYMSILQQQLLAALFRK